MPSKTGVQSTTGDTRMELNAEGILAIAHEIWSTTLDLEVKPGSALPAQNGQTTLLTSCIQISGDWQGAVTLSCTHDLARRAVASMFDMSVEEVGRDDMYDAIGEMANMVAGNMKPMLSPTCRLSPPAVVEGVEYELRIPGARLIHETPMECEGMPFAVSVFKKVEEEKK